MTIEERLSALTMNLELTARETADLRESVAALNKSTAELNKYTTDTRESVDAHVQGTWNLLQVSQSHERSLNRIEGAGE